MTDASSANDLHGRFQILKKAEFRQNNVRTDR